MDGVGTFVGSYQSGQMGLTVNQLSSTSGVRIPHCPPVHRSGPCGAAVAHSLGKTVVMGSIPITGSQWFLNGACTIVPSAPFLLSGCLDG